MTDNAADRVREEPLREANHVAIENAAASVAGAAAKIGQNLSHDPTFEFSASVEWQVSCS